MPFWPFVTADSAPRLVLSVTVPPDCVTLFPYASLAWTETVAEDVPSAKRVWGAAEIVVVAADAGPATVVIVPLVPVRLVLSVAVTV